MGIYLNPGNTEFSEITAGSYVDKTGLISLINATINKTNKLMCISRPRRFGKSFAAKMLCAYYDRTVDSGALFNKFEISSDPTYAGYKNAFNVIYLDIASFISDMKQPGVPMDDISQKISAAIRADVTDEYPALAETTILTECILKYVELSGRKIIFIIDEWDAVIREATGNEIIQKNYLNLLRSLFKNGNFTAKAVAAAYMTGILPIKKDGSQSAISDFREYTILNPSKFARYTGFTEDEVKKLCEQHHMDFDACKNWYDGYSFANEESIYNPYSVMMAMEMGSFGSYWKQTSATESLMTYIDLQLGGSLQEKILKLIAGEQIDVNTWGFHNDFQHFTTDDDVLTLLIHLGYLTYHMDTRLARIPNEEVREEFDFLLGRAKHTRLAGLVNQSEKLLADTLAGNGDAVAKAIKHVRHTNYGPTHYNNEQSLRYAVKFAYIVCIDKYMKVEELPSGKGLADVVYIPGPNTALPALVVELKWNKDADSAIDQIKQKNYPAVLQGYVGINYEEATDEHSCVIEKMTM